MYKLCKIISVIAIVSITVFAIIACNANNSGKVINSADALKVYLDSQPANSHDKPIKVNMNVNDLMIKDISEVINSAGKFVNLDLSRSIGLTTIGDGAFMNNKAIIGIVIPDSVTNIGGNAFRGCSNLSGVVIPNSVTNIGGNAFTGCSNLTDVVIPNSVTNIGRYAFSDCFNLTSIVIPNSITSLAGNAFIGCNNLTSFTWLGFDSSLLNGTWVDGNRWVFKFSNGSYEAGPVGQAPEDKGFYLISDGILTLFSGNYYSKIRFDGEFSVNGNKFKYGNTLYTKQ